MNTGSRANKKLAGRLLELSRDVLAAAVAAAEKSKPEAYLRSALTQARHDLKRADAYLALAAKKSGAE